jgi:hypothetical protein
MWRSNPVEDATDPAAELSPARGRQPPLQFLLDRRAGHALPTVGKEARLHEATSHEHVNRKPYRASASKCIPRFLGGHELALSHDDGWSQPETPCSLGAPNVLSGRHARVIEPEPEASTQACVELLRPAPHAHKVIVARIGSRPSQIAGSVKGRRWECQVGGGHPGNGAAATQSGDSPTVTALVGTSSLVWLPVVATRPRRTTMERGERLSVTSPILTCT